MPADRAPSLPAGRMPPCVCGHGWAFHVIPGGTENIDVYPYERHCVDCACRNYTPPTPAPGEPVMHGLTCEKVPHDPTRTGYLHGKDDDRRYDVDGVWYCGRCHHAL